MPSYAADRSWSDGFIPEIKRIVGPRLLEPSALWQDAKEATDLIVLTARDMRIAARVRRPGYSQYAHEFTIRERRDSGVETELSKIINGWGDWLFYGHASNNNRTFEKWMIVDLHAFRAGLIRDGHAGVELKYESKKNGDGTHFKAFDTRSFPKHPPILIASNHSVVEGVEAAA